MKNYIFHLSLKSLKALLPLAFFTFASCDSYLDVVPDDVPTIEDAFRNRKEAQNFKYGLFYYMPSVGKLDVDPAIMGGDEVITVLSGHQFIGDLGRLQRIAMGEQNTTKPYANLWLDRKTGTNTVADLPVFTGLSDCNLFLQNLDEPFDLFEEEKEKWAGEVLFLKAYLHFCLFQRYGPIPLIKENLPIDDTKQMQRYREPVDEVVNYIVELLEQAAAKLPLRITDETQLGLPDRCIALAMKAKALTFAASPLFNCNENYKDYKDSRGITLFPQDKSKELEKWEKAAAALKEAIDTARIAGYRLFDFRDVAIGMTLSEETILSMQVRGAVTEKWNNEIIWGNSRPENLDNTQRMCSPVWTPFNGGGTSSFSSYAPTLRTVEQFYTKNGIPIEDDSEWINVDRMALRPATYDERQYIRQGYKTCNLHYNREARFYGAITFDGGTYFGNNRYLTDNTLNPAYMWVTTGRMRLNASTYSRTGYLCKKLVSYHSSAPEFAGGYTAYPYSFPIIRLADLYLMYAEALNECNAGGDAAPVNPDVYQYIDNVRARSGLKGVVESWRDHGRAEVQNKPLTKGGMREIIHRERNIELAFEGVRFWDLRRWKEAEKYMNQPIRGLNINYVDESNNIEDLYQIREIFTPQFTLKDYFWPITTDALLSNAHLKQNPGWE